MIILLTLLYNKHRLLDLLYSLVGCPKTSLTMNIIISTVKQLSVVVLFVLCLGV